VLVPGICAPPQFVDMAAPGQPVCAELSPWGKNPPIRLNAGPLLITGDGTSIVAPTVHIHRATFTFDVTITEFSVRTGKPVQVLSRQRLGVEPDGPGVLWVNDSGTAMIAALDRPLPGSNSKRVRPVIGVQTLTTFTPLPAGVQHYFLTGQPTW